MRPARRMSLSEYGRLLHRLTTCSEDWLWHNIPSHQTERLFNTRLLLRHLPPKHTGVGRTTERNRPWALIFICWASPKLRD